MWSFQGSVPELKKMVETSGIEPLTPCLQGRCSPSWATPPCSVVVCQSPYLLVGLSGLEPLTSRLSGVRSNQLSYKPTWCYATQPNVWSVTQVLNLSWQPPTLPHRYQCSTIGRYSLNHRVRDENGCFPIAHRHQKFMKLSSFVFPTHIY